MLILLSKEYSVFDIKERKIRKRGRGEDINRLKWGIIIQREESKVIIGLARGYNHLNSEQSREGKPTLHLKLILGKS